MTELESLLSSLIFTQTFAGFADIGSRDVGDAGIRYPTVFEF